VVCSSVCIPSIVVIMSACHAVVHHCITIMACLHVLYRVVVVSSFIVMSSAVWCIVGRDGLNLLDSLFS
jgi:hypothetical protein